MAERYDVIIKVISKKGTCVAEHNVGDTWVLSNKTAGGICLGASLPLWSTARVLMYGGSLPWADESGAVQLTCPDAENRVVFELRAVKKER